MLGANISPQNDPTQTQPTHGRTSGTTGWPYLDSEAENSIGSPPGAGGFADSVPSRAAEPPNPVQTEPRESPRNFGEMPAIVRQLHLAMTTNYGGLFTSRVTTPEALRAWVSLWTGSFAGRDIDRLRSAVRWCLREYTHPFTTAEFERAYRSLPHQGARVQQIEHMPGAHMPGATDGTDHPQKWIKAAKPTAPSSGRRTQANVLSGKWTEEDEAGFQRNLANCGIILDPRVPYHAPGGPRSCAYAGCPSPGTISSTTVGGGTWYCGSHFRA